MKTKTYTDFKQSCKLSKILPHESADLVWSRDSEEDRWVVELVLYSAVVCPSWIDKSKFIIPCWSLAALLDVLPKPTKRIYELNIYGGDEKPFFGLNDCDMNIHEGFEGDNYVDACVNMIIELHNRELL